MPNFLVMDSETSGGAGAARAFLYSNGSPTQIGNDFGASRYNGATTDWGATRSELIQFGGELYGMARDGVYKKDDPTTMTGDWTIQIAFDNEQPGSANGAGTWGLHACNYNGIAGLVGVFKDDSQENRWRWVKFDGTTWTQAASNQVGPGGPHIVDVVVYHNVLHVITGSATGPAITAGAFDPSTDLFSVSTEGFWDSTSNQAFCVFEDRLFCAAKGSNQTWTIFEFSGTWTETAVTSMSAAMANIPQGKASLFTDGTYMYTIFAGGSGNGYAAFRIDSSLVKTDISIATLPTNLLHTGYGGGAYADSATTDRMIPVYDLNSAVGTTDIYLFRATTTGGSWTVYKWNGDAALLTVVDSGGGHTRHSLSSTLSMGERIFTPGDLDIRIVGRVASPGGEQVSFVAYGGGTGRKMKLHYALEGTPPLLEATLSAPVTGGSATLNVGLNQVEGIAADGVTVYTILWDAGTDGLVSGQRAIRSPQLLV